MDGEKQVSPVRVLRLTASSLLGFTVALMPAAFGGSDGGSAKRTAEAVAGRAPGLVAAGDVRPRLGATRTATAATATSIPGARVAATLAAGTRVAGVPPVAKMVLDKVEATNRQLAANAQRMAAEAAAGRT